MGQTYTTISRVQPKPLNVENFNDVRKLKYKSPLSIPVRLKNSFPNPDI